MVAWNGPRAKVQIRLSIQRLRTLQEKKHALAKTCRRDIADLLAKGRVETCRLRVEGLIQDDIHSELLELLELYLEMLQARFGMLDASIGTEPDPSVSDAVCAIIYAAPRTELKELQVLRDILMHKFGRAFAITLLPADSPPATVPERVASKLALYTPSAELVDAYLWEIAKGYGVRWAPEGSGREGVVEGAGQDGEGDGGGEGGGEVEGAKAVREEKDVSPEKTETAEPNSSLATGRKQSEEEELAKRFERLKNL